MTDLSKFDSQTRFLLANPQEANFLEAAAAPVRFILRGQERFTAEQLETLRELGITVRTVAGDVLTADGQLAALNDVSDLDFITALQVSQPLFYDEEPPPLFAADE